MTDYLVAISVGPVQSLIEAGRRSQDLWCGSWLLSQVAGAIAAELDGKPHCSRIFPSPHLNVSEQAEGGEPEANIANVVRAVVSANNEEALKQQIARAKQAATSKLGSIFSGVLANENLREVGIDPESWAQQQNDVLEMFAAWVAFKPDQYQSASQRLGELLHARKRTRDFLPMQDNRSGLHKSTLDGANNALTHALTNKTVAEKLNLCPDEIERKKRILGLTDEESLDALGIVKRLAGKHEQFTPFSRVVVDPWLQSLSDDYLQRLNDLYKPFYEAKRVTAVKGNQGYYQKFPYDGEYLFASRLEASEFDDENAYKELHRFLTKDVVDQYGEPVPYGVLLKADGDRMGELFAQADNTTQSINISDALHRFASDVRAMIRGFGGHAIYTGGDDILAFLPLHRAIPCAQKLANHFTAAMNAVIQNNFNNPQMVAPTLSVGLAIGHFVQPMRQLRQRAIAAEKHAKGNDEQAPRNALAVHLGIRSGHEITWRCRWDDSATLDAFSAFVKAFSQDLMPTRIMQDIRNMAHQLKWLENENGPDVSDIRRSELERMLVRAAFAHNHTTKERESGEMQGRIHKLKGHLRTQASRYSLDELANQLILARWLSAKTAKDIGGED